MKSGTIDQPLPRSTPLFRVVHNEQRTFSGKNPIQVDLLQHGGEQSAGARIQWNIPRILAHRALLSKRGVVLDDLLHLIQSVLRCANDDTFVRKARLQSLRPLGSPHTVASKGKYEALLHGKQPENTPASSSACTSNNTRKTGQGDPSSTPETEREERSSRRR